MGHRALPRTAAMGAPDAVQLAETAPVAVLAAMIETKIAV
jgi:hypothetical protein